MPRSMKSLPVGFLTVSLLSTLVHLPGGAANNNYSVRTQQLLASTTQGARRLPAKVPASPLVQVPLRSWLPKKAAPRLVLLCIHALGFSSKSYDNFGRRMAAAGIPTYALDVRGFGKWLKQSDKDHLDFEACFTDVEQGLKTLHKAYPRLPIFLVGESMGGAIAIQAAARYPDLVNGLVTAVPSSEVRSGHIKSGLIVAFSTIRNSASEIDMAPVIVDGATTDRVLRARINAEPLNRMDLSAKELSQFKRFMKDTHDAAPLVERTPVMMLVAYKDKLVTPAGSVELFSEMTTPQRMLIGDGNSQHLMLEEAQMTLEVERILKGWLRDKAGQPLGGRAGAAR